MQTKGEEEALARHFLMAECEQTVRDMAGHVGEQVHAVLQRNGMLMVTTAGAIGVGVLAAVQVLADTVEFARRSMDTDEERAAVEAGIAKLFTDEIAAVLPALGLPS